MNNSRKGKKNKVKPGFGIRDYYNFYKKRYESKRHSIEYKRYKNIMSDFNQLIIEEIVFKNYEFKLPYRLGILELRKLKPEVKIKNGKIINRNPIDIRSTMNLWEQDNSAKENKILIRYTNKHTNGYIFFIKYYKSSAHYKNKSAYTFEIFRKVNNLITKAVKEYNIDTYII